MEKKISQERFEEAIKNIDKKMKDLSDNFSNAVLPHAKRFVRGNFFKAIISVFIIGIITGVVFSIKGKSRGKK